ncbi:hypothetical protein ACWEQ4_00915 [Rhodococcus sp. NPDC003994]
MTAPERTQPNKRDRRKIRTLIRRRDHLTKMLDAAPPERAGQDGWIKGEVAALDWALEALGTYTNRIHTRDDLDALPDRTAFVDQMNDIVQKRGNWYYTAESAPMTADSVVRYLPGRICFNPRPITEQDPE